MIKTFSSIEKNIHGERMEKMYSEIPAILDELLMWMVASDTILDIQERRGIMQNKKSSLKTRDEKVEASVNFSLTNLKAIMLKLYIRYKQDNRDTISTVVE